MAFLPPISQIKGNDDVDLIAEQIRLGLGEAQGYQQSDVSFDGVGIEYRIIAEDTDNKFTPWVGHIDTFSWKEHPWLQLYTQIPKDEPYEIPTEFDPNLALAIVRGKDLNEAKRRGREFLNSVTLEGQDASGNALRSNLNFLHANTERILEF